MKTRNLLVTLLCVIPFTIAGGGDFPSQQEQRQEREFRRPRHEKGVDWTIIIVSALGCVGTVAPAYFGYRAIQKRRQNKQCE